MTRIVYENEPFEASREEAAYLADLLGGNLEMRAGKARIIRVSGHLIMPGGTIVRIRSRKATPASLMAWAAYADPTLAGTRLLGTVPEASDAGDFAGAVASAFCMATLRAIEQSGVLRSYTRRRVRTAAIRGRIDFNRVARTGGDLSRTPCTVFTRLPHTPLNRLLSATVDAVRRDPVMRTAAGACLPPLIAAYADVPPALDRELLAGRRPLTRLERPFDGPFALAKLIVRALGLLGGDTTTGLAFLVDLAALFEQAVVRAFADSSLASKPNYPVHVHRHAQSGTAQAATPMFIDVFLPDVAGSPIVVDAKYKSGVAAANLQQMVTYCWLTGARTAALVFPRGQVADRRPYVFTPGHAGDVPVVVHILELDLAGRDLVGWRIAADRLVQDLLGCIDRPRSALARVVAEVPGGALVSQSTAPNERY